MEGLTPISQMDVPNPCKIPHTPGQHRDRGWCGAKYLTVRQQALFRHGPDNGTFAAQYADPRIGEVRALENLGKRGDKA